jgi:hypothetical protein
MEETLARRVFQGLNGDVALRCPHQVGEFFVRSAESGRACLKLSGILHTKHKSRQLPALETCDYCFFMINNNSVVSGGERRGSLSDR